MVKSRFEQVHLSYTIHQFPYHNMVGTLLLLTRSGRFLLQQGARSNQGERNKEGGTLPLDALDADATGMARDNLSDQKEADAEATEGAVKIAGAVEAIEDQRQFVGGNTDALIAHPDFDFTQLAGRLADRAQANFDFAAALTVFNGIIEQVAQHLRDALFVIDAEQGIVGDDAIERVLEFTLAHPERVAFDNAGERRQDIVGSQP